MILKAISAWGWLGLACETKGHDGCGAILSRLRETNGAIVSILCVTKQDVRDPHLV